ncbi:MAG TPA: NAD(P)/FAD-dependent oxidoreductase [Nocardioidaceae bacterium]|nr:NAD(P)/FAD-dependent oxidoreductase [Nocardioidaceae bacterium]
MAQVVVVGAGIAGVSAAARLAKLGHRVVVLERRAQVGGALGRVDADGFRWEAGPHSTLLPAVLRDLFRKSGRPLERYLELDMRPIARRHVFADGSTVDLPTGSRGAQTRAIDAGLGPGTGAAWTAFVDAQADVWQSLRRQVLDDPSGGARLADRPVAASVGGTGSLDRLLRRGLRDDRLRAMVAVSFELAGSAIRNVPAFGAVEPYVERAFGLWEPAAGMAGLADVLATRLDERGVEVRPQTKAARLVWDERLASVIGVETTDGASLDADTVVCAIDARQVFADLLPALAAPRARRVFDKATPAIPPEIVHLGLSGEVPTLPPEVVLHGEPLVAVHTGDHAPTGHHAWTVHVRGSSSEDVVATLARRGIDVRSQVVARVDRSAADVARENAGSSYGLAWDGYRNYARRAALVTPVSGLHLIGASVHPGAGVAFAAWGAAHAAARIGPA